MPVISIFEDRAPNTASWKPSMNHLIESFYPIEAPIAAVLSNLGQNKLNKNDIFARSDLPKGKISAMPI